MKFTPNHKTYFLFHRLTGDDEASFSRNIESIPNFAISSSTFLICSDATVSQILAVLLKDVSNHFGINLLETRGLMGVYDPSNFLTDFQRTIFDKD